MVSTLLVNSYVHTAPPVAQAELPTADNIVFDSTYNPATLHRMEGVAFNEDGTTMYTARGGQLTIMVHTLSTAWDITTASIDSTFDLGGATSATFGLTFSSDGMKVYAASGSSNDNISQWDLVDPYDLPGIAGVLPTTIIGAFNPYDLSFDSTGQYLYAGETATTNNTVVQTHTLSTPWELSTRTSSLRNSLQVAAGLPELRQLGIQMSGDGRRIWSGSWDNAKVYTYDMSIANNISTNTWFVAGEGEVGPGPPTRVPHMFVPPGRKELYIAWGITVRIEKFTWT